MMFKYLLALAIALTASAAPTKSEARAGCPPVSGNFNVTNYRLYPENADWDSINCKYYLGSNFNASVLVYDPYKKTQKILEFPGITNTDPSHLSGVDFDAKTGIMYFSANSGTPWVTKGKDGTGPNYLIKYSVKTNSVLSTVNLQSYQNTVKARTGQLITGYRDQAEDDAGNSYLIWSYGSGISKVTPKNVHTEFYTPASLNVSQAGINGIVYNDGKLIAVNNVNGTMYTWDTSATTPAPVTVPISALGSTVPNCDGLYAPPRFGGQIILCSADGFGITVFQSKTSWKTASYLGAVLQVKDFTAPPNLGFGTSTVQISQSLYMIEDFFLDTGVYDVAGTRSVFPQIDITFQVLTLISNAAAGKAPSNLPSSL